ncbi:alpha/beta fold hydrolase [Mycoplasma simbae]|uniref:alpha/beta fold hydrolase n=1 Tax=Mycoplasma simbae TaxID=36744 RepID=UPI000496A42D|nr:alpha/beta hydrolase [Mycoplasma simbae]
MDNFFTFKNRHIEFLKMDNSKDKTILFIHGFSSEFAFFEQLIELLKPNYNIFALNMPSHGNSEIAPELMNMESFREIVVEFVRLQNLNNITLIGHSMGGGISSIVAPVLQKENRLDKVVLLGPMNRTMLMFSHMWPLFFPRSFEQYIKLLPALYKNTEVLLKNDEFVENVKQYYASEQVQKRLDVIYEWGLRMPQEKNQSIVDQGIEAINVPLALINGDSDGIVDVDVCEQHYLKLNPATNCYVIENAGHCMWSDNFEQFKSVLISFLSK